MKRSERLAARLQKASYSVAEIETLERECEELREERDKLRRNRGKFGDCKVDTSFFGVHVEMGDRLRVTFDYHRGRPYVKIQTVRGVPPLKFAVEPDGTLEVIK